MAVVQLEVTQPSQEDAGTQRPWTAPQVSSYEAQELTKSGGVLTTDGGGLGNDCS